MSLKTYLEAIEYVLDSELNEQTGLIVFRPGARRALEESERDVALPRMGKAVFQIALGAALTGMRPVIDLRQEENCAELLLDAMCELPARVPPMTVIAGAKDAELLMEIPGLLPVYPKTPRQAAGFTRAALRQNQMTLLIADQALYEEEDEVPEDDDFIMLPLTGAEDEEADEDVPEEVADCEADGTDALREEEAAELTSDGSEEDILPIDGEDEPGEEVNPDMPPEEEAAEMTCAEPDDISLPEYGENAPSEDAAGAMVPEDAAALPDSDACARAEKPTDHLVCDVDAAGIQAEEIPADEQNEAGCAEAQPIAPVKKVFCASRMIPCDLTELNRLADELEMNVYDLAARCMSHAAKRTAAFTWIFEADAEEGECAFLPPEDKEVSVWLGCDRLTACYDPAEIAGTEAARLLRAVLRVLEKPALLIFDKEDDPV
ncbi:MAG: hypothetical protein IJE08_14965 [Clostridia bacterium]|nr:hypothetical protein [Clostridia bacterium]